MLINDALISLFDHLFIHFSLFFPVLILFSLLFRLVLDDIPKSMLSFILINKYPSNEK